MSKYKFIDNIVRQSLHFLWGEKSIKKKPFRDTSLFLFYNPTEHLVFLGKKRIYYEKILQDKIKKLINRGDTVFDIGANIGQYALLFSDLVGNNGKVISIEPDNNNFEYLTLNKSENNCNNLFIVNKAVGVTNGKMKLYQDIITGGRKSSLIEEFSSSNNRLQDIEVVTLIQLINEYGVPQFIKIDIEGFEGALFESFKSSIFSNDTTWLVEVRDSTKNACFNAFQFTHNCYVIDTKNDTFIMDIESIPAFANLLFVPKVKQTTT